MLTGHRQRNEANYRSAATFTGEAVNLLSMPIAIKETAAITDRSETVSIAGT